MTARDKFESQVARAFYLGALGGGVITFLLLLWLDITHFRRSVIFFPIAVFLAGGPIVNKARGLFSPFSSPDAHEPPKVVVWKHLALFATFINGSILSLLLLYFVLLTSRGGR